MSGIDNALTQIGESVFIQLFLSQPVIAYQECCMGGKGADEFLIIL